ncbi:MAG: aspartyl protease family protein [Flammeovirgaceae bacterium]
MVIPLKINGSDTLNFILDSGVSKTIMTNLYFEGSIFLNKARDIKITGLGGGEPIPAIVSSENVVSLNGVEGVNQEIYVLLEDIFFLSTSMGMQIHGLIGYSIFKDFVVEIDYIKESLTLHDPSRYKYKRRRKGQRFPISIEKYKPYVEGLAYQTDSGSAPLETKVKLLIDTGASHALSLYDYTDNRIKIPKKSFRSYLGRGLNGDIHGNVGRLQRFILGTYQFNQPVVTYPDEDDIAIALKSSDRSGSIGSELLRRFRIVMNYTQKEIILYKNGNYKSRFSYNMSGIDIGTPIPGINYYNIAHIRPNSPADLVGIKRGDDIISVNGTLANQLDLNDLIRIFHGKPNKRIKLKVIRAGRAIKFDFELKELI